MTGSAATTDGDTQPVTWRSGGNIDSIRSFACASGSVPRTQRAGTADTRSRPTSSEALSALLPAPLHSVPRAPRRRARIHLVGDLVAHEGEDRVGVVAELGHFSDQERIGEVGFGRRGERGWWQRRRRNGQGDGDERSERECER